MWLLPTIIILIGVAPLFRFTSTVVGVNLVAIWVLTPGACDALGLGALLAYLNSHEDEFLISKQKVLYFLLLTGLFITIVLPILPYLNAQNFSLAPWQTWKRTALCLSRRSGCAWL